MLLTVLLLLTMSMNRLSILVLGSEGAIGTRLIEIISEILSDITVIRVGRKNPVSGDLSRPAGTILYGDLLDSYFIKTIFEEHGVNVVIYCAAKWNGLNHDPAVLDDNVTMFNNILSALPQSVSNFIYLSSSAVYTIPNADDTLPIEILPKSTYGQSKLINEILLLNKAKLNKMAVSIYRPFHVVSPYESYCPGRSHITTDFVHRYIELNTDFNWDTLSRDVFIPFYWVDDLCKVVADNIFNQAFVGKIFNIGAPKSYSVLDLAISVATIAKKYGLSSKEIPALNDNFVPIDNDMVSGLTSIVSNAEDKGLLEIVERFITEKYGIAYEC
jgi:nucleoside-diphosphate-sugar epimerase